MTPEDKITKSKDYFNNLYFSNYGLSKWIDLELSPNTLKDESEAVVDAVEKAKTDILEELQQHHKKTDKRFDSVDSSNEEILRLQNEVLEKTEKIENLKIDISKILGLLREDISSKKTDSIYNLEIIGGIIIVITAIVFSKTLGFILFPMIIIGLGIFLTSLVSKIKINKMRKEYGI